MHLYIIHCCGHSLPTLAALMIFPLLAPVTRPVLRMVEASSLAADLAPELRLVRPGLVTLATQVSLSGHSEASTSLAMEAIHGVSSVAL